MSRSNSTGVGIGSCGCALAVRVQNSNTASQNHRALFVRRFPSPTGPAPVAPATINRDDKGHATLRAARLDKPLVIDGRLDDEVYVRVPGAGDTFYDRRNGFFFQTSPLGTIRDQSVVEVRVKRDVPSQQHRRAGDAPRAVGHHGRPGIELRRRLRRQPRVLPDAVEQCAAQLGVSAQQPVLRRLQRTAATRSAAACPTCSTARSRPKSHAFCASSHGPT
jgi:hypothetical protein